jgi:AcrR family transcriptional regulator
VTTDIAHDRTDAAPTPAAAAAPDGPSLSPRRERTRERLLDAAYEQFAAHGIHGTSIEAVCEAAGFTRGAFYSNFESKEELFLALTDRECRLRIDSIEDAVTTLPVDPVRDGALSPEAVTSVLTAVMADPGDERRWHLMSTEFELLALRDPDVAARYSLQQERLFAELATLLDRVVHQVGMRFTVDSDTAARLLVSAHTLTVREAHLGGDAASAAESLGRSVLLRALVGLLVELDPRARS